MKAKIFAVAFALCLSLAAPVCVYADDTAASDSTATAETASGVSREDVQSMQGEIDDAMDKYDGGIKRAFQSVKDTWEQAITGPLSFANFLSYAFGGIISALPVYTVYLILLCVFLAVIGVIAAFKN